jgi:hypothetical protein
MEVKTSKFLKVNALTEVKMQKPLKLRFNGSLKGRSVKS